MNILVTGGSGFLGAYVVAALAEAGHHPVIYDVVEPTGEIASILSPLSQRWKYSLGHIGDTARLFDVCKSERIELIVHNAALVGQQLSLTQPMTTYQTNVMGSVNVCEVARQTGVAKLIYISSNAVYHKGQKTSLNETDAVFSVAEGNPAGHYGASKVAAETIGLTYATFHGLDFVSLRITSVYGFGMRQPMYIKPMVENAVRGQPTRFETGGPMKRDYTYVMDCAEAICRAIETKTEQRVLNISSGTTFTAAEVAALVQRLFPGTKIEISDRLTTLEAENVKMRAPFDLTAAATALKWKPRWTLEDGIHDYADRYRRFLSSQ